MAMNPGNPTHRWTSVLGFLALHTLLLWALQMTVGGLFVLQDRGNAFAGVNIVVALYTAPLLLLPALPLWLLVRFKSRQPHRWAMLVSLSCVLAMQWFLRSAPPPHSASRRDALVSGAPASAPLQVSKPEPRARAEPRRGRQLAET